MIGGMDVEAMPDRGKRAFDEPIPLPRARVHGLAKPFTESCHSKSTAIALLFELSGLITAPGLGKSTLYINLKEFFLLLSSTGLVCRRCELIRVDGDELGIVFLEQGKYAKRKSSKPRSAVVE